jgi:hypothetical protein
MATDPDGNGWASQRGSIRSLSGTARSEKDVNSASDGTPGPNEPRSLYVLRDGSMSSRDGDATSENPIVGRTAFWSDDETKKLNLNTASEGTYWDTFAQLRRCLSEKVRRGRQKGLSAARKPWLPTMRIRRGPRRWTDTRARIPFRGAASCHSSSIGW